MSWLTKLLGLTPEKNNLIAEGAEKLQTATEFLGATAERLEDPKAGSLADIIEATLPWAENVADTIGEAVPPVKAVLKIVRLLSRETDPRLLGLLAFSLAYQATVAKAVRGIEQDPLYKSQIAAHLSEKAVRRTVHTASTQDRLKDFEGFRLEAALTHRLVKRADLALQQVAEAAGYPEQLRRELIQRVHRTLVDQMRAIICDGSVKEKFDPLLRFLSLDNRTSSTQAVIDRHIRYQLWRFGEARALGREGTMSVPCSLKKIFVPLDCGVMNWGGIRELSQPKSPSNEGRSPFDESCGGRNDMLSEVTRLLGDPSLNDVIVIQGVAGSGKSAFTLQLCSALSELGLRPIRIRMRDLSLDPQLSLLEDVRGALLENCGDDAFDVTYGARPSASDIDLSHLLDISIPFGKASIAPNVLIFDGWDEISISASEGFRIRIEKTLAAIRQLQSGHTHRVRIILTGRPSEDVNQAKFLREHTPVLTVRPMTKPGLVGLADQLLQHQREAASATEVPVDLSGRIDSLLRQFDEDVAADGNKGQSILGLPLIALLAIWLVLNDRSPPEDLLTNRTSLYRRLVDLTCPYGGSVDDIGPERARIVGDELRNLLRHTAAAMTMRGTEQISNDELVLRLETEGLMDATDRSVIDDQLAKLTLSFFFIPGPRERGGEFIHKSFREYLFAEAIVEGVKCIGPQRRTPSKRTQYWREFDESDPRSVAVELLGRLLGPQWLTADVVRHVRWLVAWEIRRAVAADQKWQERNETRPNSLSEWKAARDSLADLWDWWGEGVHLRPQPKRERGGQSVSFAEPYAVRLSKEIVPVDLPRGALPEPVRVTTLDAHLGDGLFRLNCMVHFEINCATGWLDRRGEEQLARSLWNGALKASHPYQINIVEGGGEWVIFCPTGLAQDQDYWMHYCGRIDAAGWRSGGPFPGGIDMSGVDLSHVWSPARPIFNAVLRYAHLAGAIFPAAYLRGCDLRDIQAEGIQLLEASLYGCSLDGANLAGADLGSARISGASFVNADLRKINNRDSTWFDMDKGVLHGRVAIGARFIEGGPESYFSFG